MTFRDGVNKGEAYFDWTTYQYIDPNAGNTTGLNEGTITSADIMQINSYYPFGLNMEGNWNGAAGSNKYAYNGKEWNDDFGLGWNDYGARMYDPVVGRWWNIDPMTEKVINETPYNYTSNSPINYVDIGGNYKFPAGTIYQKLEKYLNGGIQNLLKQQDIRDGLIVIGNFTEDKINEISKFGVGPEITIRALDTDEDNAQGLEKNGETTIGNFSIDQTLAGQLQNAMPGSKEEEAALLAILKTILHETMHVGINTNSGPGYNKKERDISNGKFSRTYNPKNDVYQYFYNGEFIGDSNEHGKAFENAFYNGKDANGNSDAKMKQGKEGLISQEKEAFRLRNEKRDNLIPKL